MQELIIRVRALQNIDFPRTPWEPDYSLVDGIWEKASACGYREQDDALNIARTAALRALVTGRDMRLPDTIRFEVVV